MKYPSAFVMAGANLVIALLGLALLRSPHADFTGMLLMLAVVPVLAVLAIGFAIRDILKRTQVAYAVVAICASVLTVGLRLLIRI